jgi:hypothetical protein
LREDYGACSINPYHKVAVAEIEHYIMSAAVRVAANTTTAVPIIIIILPQTKASFIIIAV